MKAHINKPEGKKNPSKVKSALSKEGDRMPSNELLDNRSEAVNQRKLQEWANNSPRALQLRNMQAAADASMFNTELSQGPEEGISNSIGQPANDQIPVQRKVIFSNVKGDDGSLFFERTKPSLFKGELDEAEIYVLNRIASSSKKEESITVLDGKFWPLAVIEEVKNYISKAYQVLTGIMARAKGRVANNAEKFEMTYSKKDFFFIFDKAKELGLEDDVIEDLIYTGSRIRKPKTAERLATEMTNWATIVNVEGGIPYKFEKDGDGGEKVPDPEKFTAFSRDLHAKLEEKNLPHGDVRIQGSSLRTPEAGDVDLAIMLTPAAFKAQIHQLYAARFKLSADDSQVNLLTMGYDQFLEMAQQIYDKDQSTYKSSGKARSVAYVILQGLISGKDNRITALKDATTEFAATYPDQNVESISMVVIGGEFDMKPYLRI